MSHQTPLPDPLPRAHPRRREALLLALLVLAIGWIVWNWLQSEQDAETSKQEALISADNAAAIAGNVRAECDRNGFIARQLGDLCRQAEAVEDDPAETIPGPQGKRGPSCVEELGLEACRGPQGNPGIGIKGDMGNPGIPGPSCGEEFGFEACRGPQGAQGIQGNQGGTGLSCVEELGLEACRGPAGQDGADSTVPGPAGADGQDGRGIVAVELVNGGECRLVITYTDGTADSFDLNPSMCKAEEPPPGDG